MELIVNKMDTNFIVYFRFEVFTHYQSVETFEQHN